METVIECWNMRCPACRADDEIDIAATVWVRLVPDGTDMLAAANGDTEWAGDSPASCRGCGYRGKASAFEIGRDA